MMQGLQERPVPEDRALAEGRPEGEALAIVDVVEVIEDHTLEILEIIEIELYASSGKRKPRARTYVFRVGKQRIEVKDPILKGRQILELAHKLPPENYTLRQIFHGAEPKVIELDETVDLRAPGVERFRAMPRTARDGM
jgi:Multiubiquitin